MNRKTYYIETVPEHYVSSPTITLNIKNSEYLKHKTFYDNVLRMWGSSILELEKLDERLKENEICFKEIIKTVEDGE